MIIIHVTSSGFTAIQQKKRSVSPVTCRNSAGISGSMDLIIRNMRNRPFIDLTFDYDSEEEEAARPKSGGVNKWDNDFDRARYIQQLKELPFPFYVNNLYH